MRLSLLLIGRQLRRSPGELFRLVPTLAVLATLLLTLLAIGDTLERRSTGLLRALDADAFVFDDESRGQVLRSRVPRPATIGAGFADSVHEIGVFAALPTTVEDGLGTTRATLVGFNARTPAEPVRVLAGRLPLDGQPRVAAVDATLAGRGIGLGDSVVLGDSLEVEVVGIVASAMFLQQPTVWVPQDTWARTGARAFPERGYADALVGVAAVQGRSDATFEQLRSELQEELTEVGVEVLSPRQARASVPGVTAQRATFGALVAVAAIVVGIVMAAVAANAIEQERPRDAQLRAIGVPGPVLATLAAGRLAVIAVATLLVSVGLTGGLARLVPEVVPLALSGTAVFTATVTVLVALAVGATPAIRRVLNADPVDAMRRNA